jgi:hypothetical protein
VAPEGDAVWEARTQRILARSDLAWDAAEARRTTTSWFLELGRWLSPAAALAAAAAALMLIAAGNRSALIETDADAAALSLISADGDPVALWATFGVTADPVLALLTLEDHMAWTTRADPVRPDTGERQ